ncbi:MAG: histidinol dehydrogenase [Acidobacteriota bacterium]
MTRNTRHARDTSRIVGEILAVVRDGGEQSVLDLTQRYDGVRRRTLEVAADEWQRGVSAVDSGTLAAIGAAGSRIARFARAQHQSLRPVRLVEPGVILEQRLLPVQRVGIYVPGGRHPLCSSVLMGALPAREAGCREIILATPARRDGTIHPAILAAARIAAVNRVFAMGGAQAIAAMAYGAGPVPAVDLIVGPGNRYVTEAKAQLAGRVGIDMMAGPSELAVIADATADPAVVAADLLAQAEHDPDARLWLFLIGTRRLAAQVRTHLRDQCATLPGGSPNRQAAAASLAGLVVRTFRRADDACAASDEVAPEHLSVQVKKPGPLIRRLTSYGSLFVGRDAAVALGDYVSGPNHTLPTGGAARHTGGLSVLRFLKVVTLQRVTRAGARRLAPTAGRLAALEGLEAHRRSIVRRSPVPRIAAVVFDFNGVLVDDEPWHWQAMREAVEPLGLVLSWRRYKARYLHYDDHTALSRMLDDAEVVPPTSLDRLVARKRRLYRGRVPPDGGIAGPIAALVRAVAREVPIAIVSGAARSEVVHAVKRAGLRSHFATIIGAEDVSLPKPDPEGYSLAVRRLMAKRLLTEGLPVLAVEDSPGGAGAALAAGLEVFGIATTYSAARLRRAGASRVAPALAGLVPSDLLS